MDTPFRSSSLMKHGGYSRPIRYDITQHRYAGASWDDGGEYIEVLKVHNPPYGAFGVVLHWDRVRLGSIYYEFTTVNAANRAFDAMFFSRPEGIKNDPGYLKSVQCSFSEAPWFYRLEDDPAPPLVPAFDGQLFLPFFEP